MNGSEAPAAIAVERKNYHQTLLGDGVLCISERGVPSNADGDSRASVVIARGILERIEMRSSAGHRMAGQSSGNRFEQITGAFIQSTFTRLAHLRPGRWEHTPRKRAIARFEQYRHLEELEQLADQNGQLAAAIGRDYVIAPDLVVVRHPEPDSVINAEGQLVDETVARRASLRADNGAFPFLHASISCKWTLRSDRAQNARSEALNLIRNRKGRLPHVVLVTGEPLPSRLASITLGTGDLDCVYHFALPELVEAVEAYDNDDAFRLIGMMVEGGRLKDITDLPLDLAV